MLYFIISFLQPPPDITFYFCNSIQSWITPIREEYPDIKRESQTDISLAL